MPNLQSQATTFRASGYRYTGYIGTIPETIVYTALVNQASFTYPLKTINIDNGVGTFGNVKEDMEVKIYSQSTTTVKGRLRVASGVGTSSTLQINEIAQAYLDIADNDKIEILESWRIHDKLVEASKNFRKDSRLTYSDQGSNPNPVANGGGAWFGFVDAGQSYATVARDGSGSFVVDPDGGTLSYSWAIGDGTVISGATNTATFSATFPVGFRHITLTVTNSGSSKTAVKYIPIRVFDADQPPLRARLDSRNYTHQTGWTMTFSLPAGSESDLDNLPDGALIVYFEQEIYDADTIGSYGSNIAGSSHIKFVGYLVRESIRIDPDTDEVVFEAESPLAILEKTPALPQLMTTKTNPVKWSQVKGLTVNRALWYFWYWHASVAAYFDFHWHSGTDLAYKELSVNNGDNMAGQMRDIADALNLKFTCDRLGRLLFIRDPDYLDEADRASRTTAYQLTTADIMELDMAREHRRRVKLVEGRAFTSAGKGLYSRAPGNAPAPDAVGSELLDRQIVSNQAELNLRTGRHYAKLNGTYYDSASKSSRHVPQGVTLTLPDSYDVFDPAYLDYITLTLADTTNARGLAIASTERWLIESMSVDYDPDEGTKSIRLTLNHETQGLAGVTYIPPQAGTFSLPPITPIDFNFPAFDWPPLPTFALPGAPGVMAMFSANQLLWNTNDYSTSSASGGPSWLSTSLGSAGTIGTTISATVDPYSPKYTNTGTTVHARLATTTRIYKIEDIHGAKTLTLQHTFAASLSGNNRLIKGSIAASGWFMCASYYGSSGGVKVAYTTDGGTTWTEVQVTAHYNSSALTPVQPTLAMSDVIPGLAYVFAFTATGSRSAATSGIYKTTDYGATWVACSGSDPQATNHSHLGHCLHIIGHNNPNQNKVLWSKLDNTTIGSATSQTCNALHRSIGSTQTNIAPMAGSPTIRPFGSMSSRAGFGVHSCRTDGNLIVLAGRDRAEDSGKRGVFVSRDGGATWMLVTDLLSEGSSGYTDAFVADDGAALHLWGEGGLLSFSNDVGATLDSRAGNSGLASSVLLLAGG